MTRQLLERIFPWLLTDDGVSGADVVEVIRQWHESLPAGLQQAHCDYCGAPNMPAGKHESRCPVPRWATIAYEMLALIAPYHRNDGRWPWCESCHSWHHPDNPTCKEIDELPTTPRS